MGVEHNLYRYDFRKIAVSIENRGRFLPVEVPKVELEHALDLLISVGKSFG